MKAFDLGPPLITNVSPKVLTRGIATVITITGMNLFPDAKVVLFRQGTTIFGTDISTAKGDEEMKVTFKPSVTDTPAAAGYKIRVTNGGGQKAEFLGIEVK